LLSIGGWVLVVMSWIAGFLRAFRRVCRRLFCGGLCTLLIRLAYLHTTSSVLVHRAIVSIGPAICGYAYAECRPCCACVLPAFPSGVRGLRDFQRGLRGVRGALSQALHAVCDAHLVPTLRALHYCVAYAFLSANVPRFAVRVYCVVLRGTHHTLPTRGFFFTDGRRTILDCAAVGAEFALPGVASGLEVLGVWLMPPLLVV
jgi:hypothetical protein